LSIFKKYVNEIQVSLKCDTKSTGHINHGVSALQYFSTLSHKRTIFVKYYRA